jgi:hypothetical protein
LAAAEECFRQLSLDQALQKIFASMGASMNGTCVLALLLYMVKAFFDSDAPHGENFLDYEFRTSLWYLASRFYPVLAAMKPGGPVL